MGSMDAEARGKLLHDLALLGRMDERWRKLSTLVESKEITVDSALRGFRLAIEAALGEPASGAESARLVEPGLTATERGEFERLRAHAADFERELAAARLANELQEARVTELEEMLFGTHSSGMAETAQEVPQGKRVSHPSVPPPETTDNPVEDWRAHVNSFFTLYGQDAAVPCPALTAEELEQGRHEGLEIIYRPPSVRVTYENLMVANGYSDHSTLRQGDRERIGFQEASEGYWFWAEVAEISSRRGKCFKDFESETPSGWEILSLEEYFLAFAVMRDIHCTFLDVDEPVCLRTTHGNSEVLQVRSHIIRGGVELIVRSLPRAFTFKKLGARYRRLIPSVQA